MIPLSKQNYFRHIPVVRSRIWGTPAVSNVSVVNRSDVIRRIFLAKGNVNNRRIHDALADEGLRASDSLINSVRSWAVAAGHI